MVIDYKRLVHAAVGWGISIDGNELEDLPSSGKNGDPEKMAALKNSAPARSSTEDI